MHACKQVESQAPRSASKQKCCYSALVADHISLKRSLANRRVVTEWAVSIHSPPRRGLSHLCAGAFACDCDGLVPKKVLGKMTGCDFAADCCRLCWTLLATCGALHFDRMSGLVVAGALVGKHLGCCVNMLCMTASGSSCCAGMRLWMLCARVRLHVYRPRHRG